MNALLQEKLTEIILFVAILVGFHQAIAWNGPHRGVIMPVMMIDAPPIVRLTGIFYPAEKKDVKGGICILKVLVKQREWLFKVQKAENCFNPSQTQLQILKDIFPRILSLRGPESLIDSLQKLEIAGKLMVIEGALYKKSRFLMVSSVEEAVTRKERLASLGSGLFCMLFCQFSFFSQAIFLK